MLLAKTNDQKSWKGGWYSSGEVASRQSNCCFYCDKPLTEKRTRDHLFPRSLGFFLGGNMVIACYKCNQNKGERLPTLQEITKAWRLIYKDRPHRFICQIRNDRPVFQIGPAWYYVLNEFKCKKGNRRAQRIMRGNKPVLRLYA